jgi:excisionase family DNA binding protein
MSAPPLPKVSALSVKKFCELYDIDRATAYRAMADGRLQFVRVGSHRRIRLPPVVQREEQQGGIMRSHRSTARW